MRRGNLSSRDGAPRLEPFAAGAECTDARLDTVGHNQRGIVGEERRDLGLVGLELLKRGPDGRVLVRGVLQLENAKGKAVDEDHDVRPAVVLALDNRELVHR